MKKPLFLTVRISFVETLESWLTGIGAGLLVVGLITLFLFFKSTEQTFYQGIYIDDIAVGGLTKEEAAALLSEQDADTHSTISISTDTSSISSSSAELGIHKNHTASINEAFEVGRSGFPLSRLVTIVQLSFEPQHFASTFTADVNQVTEMLQQLALKVTILGENPSADLELRGVPSSLVINKGKYGLSLQQEQTKQHLLNQLQTSTSLESRVVLTATTASTAAELSEAQVIEAEQRATKFIGKKATFTADDISLSLNDQELIALLAFPEGTNNSITETVARWQEKVNREPQEPTFEYDSQTLAVTTFIPPKDGLTLNKEKAVEQIAAAIQSIENAAAFATTEEPAKDSYEFELPVSSKSPKKPLSTSNDLGITELIGFGDSEYDHSIPSRIHNVSLATSRVTNTIVKPGEEFSFNKTIGEISRQTGYQPAYVISGGKTILGDGGGVCQVSTTVFRSVLDAGLKVSKRLQHSYRVSYYELNQKPGIDATVYSGEVDFRFVNDTDHHILVHAEAFPDDLYMKVELYGTSDGRQTEITDHEVWDYRAPPPPVYSADPSLPAGVVRQIDWSVSGVKAKFTNIIKDKDGNTIREDEYYSNYVPWSAKYLRGV
jgi:vancomycin resistance protein YoaR